MSDNGSTVFARHTNSILHMLPYWFEIRKDSKNSEGARFLNVSGLELDDARYIIDYAYNQCYIQTLDLAQVDFCYKAIVPMPFKLCDLKGVFANTKGLVKAESVKDFFGIARHNVPDEGIYTYEKYYADKKRNIIYVRNQFNVDANYADGKLKLVFKDGTETIQKLVPHHVWNFLDELGALLSCPRLPREPNVEYKKRILDVFLNYAGASKPGLINGISRELGTRKIIHWTNPVKDLELEDPMIVLNSITIDQEPVPLSQVWITDAGTVLIKGDPEAEDKEKIVSYVHSLEMHQLWNKEDIKLYNELFTVEGKPKKKLLRYIENINAVAPLFWDDFHWNEHYWDMNEEDVSGVGYIPHLYDGSVRGFRQFGTVNGT